MVYYTVGDSFNEIINYNINELKELPRDELVKFSNSLNTTPQNIKRFLRTNPKSFCGLYKCKEELLTEIKLAQDIAISSLYKVNVPGTNTKKYTYCSTCDTTFKSPIQTYNKGLGYHCYICTAKEIEVQKKHKGHNYKWNTQVRVECPYCGTRQYTSFTTIPYISKLNNKCLPCRRRDEVYGKYGDYSLVYGRWYYSEVNPDGFYIKNYSDLKLFTHSMNIKPHVLLNKVNGKKGCSGIFYNKSEYKEYMQDKEAFDKQFSKVHAKEDFICNKCGYVTQVTRTNLRSKGYICEYCKYTKDINNINTIKNINKFNIINTKPIKLECKDCNSIIDLCISDLVNGSVICKTCFPNYYSKEEMILSYELKQLGINHSVNKSITNNEGTLTSIDIYIPEAKLGIEINGLAWHTYPGIRFKDSRISESDLFKKKQNQHFIKFKQLNDMGIKLLQITDIDIKTNLNLILSMICYRCGINTTKLMARKLVVKEVSSEESTEFLNTSHIQGSVGGKYKFGLYNSSKLVSCLVVNSGGELVRFANLPNHNIQGGFSKLLSHTVRYLKHNTEVTKITTFSDNMYSNGDVYKKMNFIKLYEIPIDYKYVNKQFNVIYHKSNFRKEKIKKQGLIYSDTLTERELMELNEYHRYHDAGKIKWELKI